MPSEDRSTATYNRPMTNEDVKRLYKIGSVLASSAVIFVLGFALLVHNDLVVLYPKNTQPETLKGFAARLEYTLRYQCLLVFWLLFNVFAVIYGRLSTTALNPLDERTEKRVQLLKNILQNSFESIIITVFAQLTFISFAEPATVLKFIPFINIVQFIGRVAFFVGYPLKRSFGFFCTLLINVPLVCYNLYKFCSFLGFY